MYKGPFLFVFLFLGVIIFLAHPPGYKNIQIEGQTIRVNLQVKEVLIYEGLVPVWLIEKEGNLFRMTKSMPDYHCPVSTVCTTFTLATQQEAALYKAAIKMATELETRKKL